MDLTTLENVKVLLEADEDTWQEGWDTLIEYLITSISEEVEKFCNRGFEQKSRTEQHNGGGRYLCLKALPIVSISSIKASPYWDFDDDSSEVETTEYNFEAATGLVYYKFGNWPWGEGAIQVTYTGGYAAVSNLPAGLEGAVCRQVAYTFNRRKDQGLESITFPDGSIQKVSSDQFLPSVKTALQKYRLRRLG